MDPSMRWLCVIVAVMAAGFAQLEVGVAALATNERADVKGLGWMMAAHMLTILVMQPAGATTGHRATPRVNTRCRYAAIILAWILVLAKYSSNYGIGLMITVGVVFAVPRCSLRLSYRR